MLKLKILFLFIVGSVLVNSMSIDTFFTPVFNSINFNSAYAHAILPSIIELLDLGTEIPTNGYHFSNLSVLTDYIVEADYLFELGYAHINGVLVYAIKIGDLFYSVEPRIYHSLIYILFSN